MLSGTTNEERIWNYLKAQGLSAAGAAGLMGNLYAESGLRPNNLQNSCEGKLGMADAEYTELVDHGTYKNFVRDSAGYGLCQWTYWSRKEALLAYARAQGKSIGDLEMQLGFLMQELSTGYKSLLALLKTVTTVREASDAVLLQFERPANQGAAVQEKRAGYGQKYFDKYAAKNSAATGGNNMHGATVKVYSKAQDGNTALSANFKVKEFACKDGSDTVFVSPELVEVLQKIRTKFGQAITINSAYRTDAYNKKVGGAAYSQHKYGIAADIVVKGVAPLEVAKYAETLLPKKGGIGVYGSFTHVDVRANRSRWDQRSGKQVAISGF